MAVTQSLQAIGTELNDEDSIVKVVKLVRLPIFILGRLEVRLLK